MNSYFPEYLTASVLQYAICLDAEGNYLFANEHYLDTFSIVLAETKKQPALKDVHPDDEDLFMSALEQALDKMPHVIPVVIRIRNGSGHFIYVQWEFSAEKSGATIVRGLGRDISHTIRLEQEQKEWVKRFNLAMDVGQIGIWEYNVADDLLIRDMRLKEMFSIEDNTPETLGRAFSFIHKDDVERCRRSMQNAINNKVPIHEIFRIFDRKNNLKLIDCRAIPTLDENGETSTILGLNIDITEINEKNEELEFQSVILGSIEQAVIGCDRNWNIRYMNRFAEKLFGWSADEVVGRNAFELMVTDEDRANSLGWINHMERDGFWSGEAKLRHKSGKIFLASVTEQHLKSTNGEVKGYLGISYDISEVKKMTADLKSLETKLMGLYKLADVGIVINEAESGRFVEVNPAFIKMTGYSEEELKKISYKDITPEEYVKIDEENTNHVVANGSVGHVEKEYFRKSGKRFPITITSLMYDDTDKDRKLTISVVEDMSQKRLKDTMINEALGRLVLATQSAKMGIWEWNMSNNTLIWDDMMFEIHEVPRHLFENRLEFWQSLMKVDEYSRFSEQLEKMTDEQSSLNITLSIVTYHGTVRFIEVNGICKVTPEGIRRTVGVCRDVTAVKQYEQDIINKNELLKAIAKTQAHDVRRPLANILGILYQIEREHVSPEAMQLFELLRRSAEQLDDVIHGIIQSTRN